MADKIEKAIRDRGFTDYWVMHHVWSGTTQYNIDDIGGDIVVHKGKGLTWFVWCNTEVEVSNDDPNYDRILASYLDDGNDGFGELVRELNLTLT